VMLVIGTENSLVFLKPTQTKTMKADYETELSKETLANNIETVALLGRNKWGSLSVDEKLRVLRTVVNIERRYLGLYDDEIITCAVIGVPDERLGYYSVETNKICINYNHLCHGTGEEGLNIILHEIFHAYQNKCFDALQSLDGNYQTLRKFDDIKKWGENIENYISDDESGDDYYYQVLEIDAREYAEEASEDYYRKINQYYGNTVIGNK
ncbi:MAG: hypothetical protein K6G30_11860, partial [Acetatifactor sp.]|nr:hypothetical protein [Acetatifactor sp.]